MDLEGMIDAIQRQAIEKWGDRWKAELSKAWALQVKSEASTCRPQIERVFANKGCHAATLFRLAGLVGCEIKLFCECK